MNGRLASAGPVATSRPRRWPWLVATVVRVLGVADPLLAAADPQSPGPHPLEAVVPTTTWLWLPGDSAADAAQRTGLA